MRVHQEHGVPVTVVCEVLDLPRSTYYRHAEKGDERAVQAALVSVAGDHVTYGSRRLARELRRAPFAMTVNRKRVQRLMRELGLQARRSRRSRTTTTSPSGQRPYPNLVQGMVIDRPDQVWVADITYVMLAQDAVYLAILMDVFTRAIRGWDLRRTLDHHLTLSALDDALEQHVPAIHHSDQGVQYIAGPYVQRLSARQVRISMADTGQPTQNGYAERVIRTIKEEEVYLAEYRTFADAYTQIRHFVEDVYQTKRIHSALGYLTPSEFEAAWLFDPANTSPLTMR